MEIVAHRGANREAPENTLPAFDLALAMGAQGIELDIQLSGDGVPVVHHDASLREAPGDPTEIASLSLSALRARSSVPALEEVLELVNGRCRLYVEIKAPAAVDAVVKILRGRESWCAVHSFDHRVAARACALNPRLTTGILLVSYLVDIEGAMRASGAADVWQQADYVDAALVDRVHGAGGRVMAWTVNEVRRARELAKMGVDVLCTDAPRELLAAFLPSGQANSGGA